MNFCKVLVWIDSHVYADIKLRQELNKPDKSLT